MYSFKKVTSEEIFVFENEIALWSAVIYCRENGIDVVII